MYASAMKFCGAMELCGIGYPRSEPMDYQWPDIEAQVAAQKAGLLVAITRETNPQEAVLMKTKGFAAVYKFTNPRTGNVGVLWIKDFTGGGATITKLPDYITAPVGYIDPLPAPSEDEPFSGGMLRMRTGPIATYAHMSDEPMPGQNIDAMLSRLRVARNTVPVDYIDVPSTETVYAQPVGLDDYLDDGAPF